MKRLLQYKHSLMLTFLLALFSLAPFGRSPETEPLYLATLIVVILLDILSFLPVYMDIEPGFWQYLIWGRPSNIWPTVFRVIFTTSLAATAFYKIMGLLYNYSIFTDNLSKLVLVFTITFSGLVLFIDAIRNNRKTLVGITSYSLKSALWKRVILLTAVATGLLIRFSLFANDFKEDEFQHLGSAVGYLKVGHFFVWDFVSEQLVRPYQRAWPFTWQVAQSFKVFGVSTLSGRLVPLAWGMTMIFFAYYLGKKIASDDRVGLALAWITALSLPFVTSSTYIRMYAMFIVVFAIFIYLSYQIIEANAETDIFKGIAWRYVAPTFFLGWLSYQIHIITLVSIVGIIAYLLVRLITENRYRPIYFNKYAVAITALASVIAIAFAWATTQPKDYFGLHFISLVSNLRYFELAVRPFPLTFGFPLLTLGLATSLLNRKLFYIASILLGGLFFFAFIGGRYVSGFYISNLLVFSYLLIVVGLLQSRQLIASKIFNIIALLIILLTLSSAAIQIRDFYRQLPISAPAHNDMYAYLVRNVPKDSTIWMVYPRKYYLARYPELQSVNIRNIVHNKEFNTKTLDKMLSKGKRFYVVWAIKKGVHVRPEIREYITTKLRVLKPSTEKFGYKIYVSPP